MSTKNRDCALSRLVLTIVGVDSGRRVHEIVFYTIDIKGLDNFMNGC